MWLVIIIRIQAGRIRKEFIRADYHDYSYIPEDFHSAVVIFSAAMMKKQSKSKKEEFEYFKKYYESRFKKPLTSSVLALLRTAANSRLQISRACYQLKSKITYEESLQLLHFLYGFAMSDSFISAAEMRIIRLMGRFIGVNASDLDSVHAFYFSRENKSSEASGSSYGMNQYYEILGVTEDSSHDDIRKAYRNLAMKHHPDKLAHLGEEFQQVAKEQFQIIVDAYKKIKKAKGC